MSTTKGSSMVDLFLQDEKNKLETSMLVCSRCGRYVQKYYADFFFFSKTYSLCHTCFPFAFSCFINGDILNLISFENWDLNLAKQKYIESRLLDYKFMEIL